VASGMLAIRAPGGSGRAPCRLTHDPREARPILSTHGEPHVSPDGDGAETGQAGPATGRPGRSRRGGQPGGPGVGEALGGVRESVRRLIDAHVALLRAELSRAGRELGIIVGLALAAVVLAALLGTLLYVGSLLFIGEWLFGSMGWGILHGTLMTLAFITGIGLNLAGAWMGAWARGFLVGAVVTLVLSIVFASNVLRTAAVNVAEASEDAIALHPDLLPTLVGLVAGAVLLGLLGLAAAWRMGGERAAFGPLAVGGLLIGAAVGAILGSVEFDNPGAVAVSLVIGLVTWMGTSLALAARRGFDVEGRYAALVPRATMAAFEETRDFMMRQWQRQKRRILGR
jgi:hypothetical protein